MTISRLRFAGLLILGGTLIAGCSMFEDGGNSLKIKASGTVVTVDHDALSDFNRVDASHTFDVTITQGDTFAVTLRMDGNVQEHVAVRVDGATLVLTLKDRDGGYSFGDDVTLEAIVTMPTLRGIELSGATRGTITGFVSDTSWDVRLSGASRLSGDMTAGTVNADISGASRIELIGDATALDLDLSGASEAGLYGFTINGGAKVDASGASAAEIRVNGGLDVTASGASAVRYRGEVAVGTIDESGASTVAAGE